MALHNGEIPDGVLIIRDFLNADNIAALKYFADGQIGIINKEEVTQEDGKLTIRQNEGLASERIYLREINDTALGICDEIFGRIIPEHYGASIEWYEYPHIIRYRKGGKYIPHADADVRDDGTREWIRNVDRDYSAIIYINDGFEGGSLYFPELDFRVEPRPGMLVCFPSNGRYEHTAEPVIAGIRYAFVTWAAARETRRVQGNSRGEIVFLER